MKRVRTIEIFWVEKNKMFFIKDVKTGHHLFEFFDCWGLKTFFGKLDKTKPCRYRITTEKGA